MDFFKSFIITALTGCAIYFVFGVVALAIGGDDTQASPIVSIIILVVIVVLANIIGDKISGRK